MTTNDTPDIGSIILAALKNRRGARAALADALAEILAEMPMREQIACGPHTVTIARGEYGCSQWANREWCVTGRGRVVLIDGQLLRNEERESIHDGNNLHYPKTGWHRDGEPLRMAPPSVLRAVAEHLPAALAAWTEDIAAKAAETRAAADRLASLRVAS